MNNAKNIQGLELLAFNHTGEMELKDGRIVNYGVIRRTEDVVAYYTGKGLREMWKPDMTEAEKTRADELKKIGEEKGEQELIRLGYIEITKLDDIARVIF